MSDDVIEQAIAATEPKILSVPVVIRSTMRQVVITMPEDLTESELVELFGWMGTGLLGHVRAMAAETPNAAASRLWIPQ